MSRPSAAIRPLILDLGCCGTAALQLGAPGYDWPGLDSLDLDLDPDQAAVLIVAGRVSSILVPRLKLIYARLIPPKWVIACGTCAISGAVFDTIKTEEVIPVDRCVPGCPPHPLALRDALMRLPRRRSP